MKLKKLVFIAAILSLIMLITGCGTSIYQEYTDASNKMSELTAVAGSIEYNINVQAEGITVSLPIKADYKARISGDSISEMTMDLSTELLGQDITYSAYLFGDYMYMDIEGMKIKQPYSDSEAKSFESAIMSQLTLNEEILNEASRTVEDGVVSVSVTFNGNVVKDQLFDLFGDIVSDSLGTDVDESQTNLSDVEMKYSIDKNGYMTSNGLKFSVTQTTEETGDVSIDLDMTMTVDNPGEEVEITAPQNLDEYVESTGIADDSLAA